MRSIVGVGITPPNVLGAPKPWSSVMMSKTFGAPFGGTTRGAHQGGFRGLLPDHATEFWVGRWKLFPRNCSCRGRLARHTCYLLSICRNTAKNKKCCYRNKDTSEFHGM